MWSEYEDEAIKWCESCGVLGSHGVYLYGRGDEALYRAHKCEECGYEEKVTE